MDFSKYEREIEEVVRRMLKGDTYGYFMKHAIIVSAELDDFERLIPLPERVEEAVRRSAWTCVKVCTDKPEKSFAECWRSLARTGLTEEEVAFLDEFWKYHVEKAHRYDQALRNYVLERFRERREELERITLL
jgi:hypothetical protein